MWHCAHSSVHSATFMTIPTPRESLGQRRTAVRVLVICRDIPGGDQDEFRRLVPEETAALRELKAKGLLLEAWSPGHPGAVLLFDVADEAAAASLVAAFPLVQAGLITTEIVPLHPID